MSAGLTSGRGGAGGAGGEIGHYDMSSSSAAVSSEEDDEFGRSHGGGDDDGDDDERDVNDSHASDRYEAKYASGVSRGGAPTTGSSGSASAPAPHASAAGGATAGGAGAGTGMGTTTASSSSAAAPPSSLHHPIRAVSAGATPGGTHASFSGPSFSFAPNTSGFSAGGGNIGGNIGGGNPGGNNVDLATALSMLAAFRADNVRLKQALQQTKLQADQATQAYTVLQNECNQLYAEWKTRTTELQEQLDRLHKQSASSKDIDLLRLSIRDELSIPHKKAMSALQQSLQQVQAELSSVQTHYSALRTKHELQSEESEQRYQELEQRYREEKDEWRRKHLKLQELVEDRSLMDKYRVLERENNELIIRNKKLAEEMDEMRRLKEEATVERERTVIAAQKQRIEFEGQVGVFEKQKQGLIKKFDDAQQELQRLREAQSSNHARHVKEAQEIKTLEEKLVARQQEIEFLRSHHEKRITEIRMLDEQKEKQRKIVITELQQEITDLQRTRVDFAREKELLNMEHALGVRNVRDEERKKWEQVERELRVALETGDKRYQVLEAQLKSEQQEKNDVRKEANSMRERLMVIEQDKTRMENERHEFEMERRRMMEEERRRTRDEHECQQEFALLQVQHRAVLEREQERQEENERLKIEAEALRRENQELQRENEQERAHFLTTTQQQQTLWRQEKTMLLQRLAHLDPDAVPGGVGVGGSSSSARGSSKGKAGTSESAAVLHQAKNKYKRMCIAQRQKLHELIAELANTKRSLDIAQAQAHSR